MSEKSAAKGGKAKVGPVQFLKDCRDELPKITTPTRQETIKGTTVALIVMFLIALILAAFDFVFKILMSSVI